MLMSIFDQFRVSFVFLGLRKSALIAILKTPSGSISLILGYDATASSNTTQHNIHHQDLL